MAACPSDLESLSKEELVQRVIKLEANVRQLRSILQKRNLDGNNEIELDNNKLNTKRQRKFDFQRYKKRHIALKFLYLGWDFQGYVVQEDTNDTIEDHLFEALIKTKLIESRTESNYHRCGRTDKGVSAFSQVISIDVRSTAQKGLGVFTPEDYVGEVIEPRVTDGDEQDADTSQEIDYCTVLNKVLPDQIRCLAWAPVRRDFSARFDCKSRCYHYYFPESSLNIGLMKEAAVHLVGSHDFTNFCKKDSSKSATNNQRVIYSVDISPCSSSSDDDRQHSPYQIYVVRISAGGFLWHQIRCIMAVLFLVGEGRESPDVVSKLLDTSKVPAKPQYTLASELPLVLFETDFDSKDISQWKYDSTVISNLIKHLQKLWTQEAIKSQMIRSMIQSLINWSGIVVTQQHSCLVNESWKSYKSLLERPRCGKNSE